CVLGERQPARGERRVRGRRWTGFQRSSRPVRRRTFLQIGAAAILSAGSTSQGAAAATKTLYNGIELPPVWPPRRTLDRRVVVPPYLLARPAVVPIDVGRQLFVDDFLIEQSTLVRVFHT